MFYTDRFQQKLTKDNQGNAIQINDSTMNTKFGVNQTYSYLLMLQPKPIKHKN